MNRTTVLTGGVQTPPTTRIAQGSTDKGLLLGSTVHMIGSSEGLLGNRIPVSP